MRALRKALVEVGPAFGLGGMTLTWAFGEPPPSGAWKTAWVVWAVIVLLLAFAQFVLTWALESER